MLPSPDSLSIPFKEGIRDLRCSIRLEARSGTLSSRLFGTPTPTRRLARLADDVLTQAERVAGTVFPRNEGDLGQRLDRLAASLGSGRAAERTGDIYAVCHAILEADGASGVVVSELKLAIQPDERRSTPVADPTLAAVGQAYRMMSSGIFRRCLSTSLLPGEADVDAGLDVRVALICWLAVLVRRETGTDGRLVLQGARLVADSEGDEWSRLLRSRRFDELAEIWRHTVPYLP